MTGDNAMTGAPDVDSLPPVQQMVMEVLAARHRLGEPCWTFSTRLGPALEALNRYGLITYKSGNLPKTYLAWLTGKGRGAVLIKDYPTATVAKKDVIRIRTDSGSRYKMRVTHVENYIITLADLEEGEKESS